MRVHHAIEISSSQSNNEIMNANVITFLITYKCRWYSSVKDTMLSRKHRTVRYHLGKNASHRPDVNCLTVTFGIQHDFRGSVPSCGNIFSQESSMIMIRICYTCQPKITDLDKEGGSKFMLVAVSFTTLSAWLLCKLCVTLFSLKITVKKKTSNAVVDNQLIYKLNHSYGCIRDNSGQE